MCASKRLPARDDGPVLVLGLGASGFCAARLLRSRGYAVTVLDSTATPGITERALKLRAMGARVLTGPQASPASSHPAWAVVSPGIHPDAPWLKALRQRRIPLISELELGWRASGSKILAITGSNGKSTLALLCYAVMKSAGYDVRIGGNFGEPLCGLALNRPEADWLVVEVSSFQMETSPDFRPDVGIWLNLLPNHLDRHNDMKTYAALKARLFINMRPGDQAILFEKALRACPDLRNCRARITTFGTSKQADVRCPEGQVAWLHDGQSRSVSLRGSGFDTPMLRPSAAAAVAAAMAVGIEPERVAESLKTQTPLPHRLQTAAVIRDVRFVNDAKSTNLAAVTAAVASFDRPVRLLAGGRLKEKNLTGIIQSLRPSVVSVYLWGEASEAMARAWSRDLQCSVCRSLEHAVETAWNEARRGDVVLLSPGCSSLDQFENFAARGEAFLAAVSRIKEGAEK